MAMAFHLKDPIGIIKAELNIPESSIKAASRLFEEGNTIPFIARYRKEATGNLDEVSLRKIQERLAYLKELEERRKAICESIGSQNKMTDELMKQILAAETKAELEDLYLPYKPKRRTRAQIAREKGLEPIAKKILEQPLTGDPVQGAEAFVNGEVKDAQEALKLACDIVAEMIAENPQARQLLRKKFQESGIVVCKVVEEKAKEPTKFELYYDFKEPVSKIAPHRYLAICRGRNEGVLDFSIEIDADDAVFSLLAITKCNDKSPYAKYLKLAAADSFKRLIAPSLETDLRVELKIRSDSACIQVFAENLRALLMQAPLGSFSVLGIDPGIRTGCKCALVGETGAYIDSVTIYPSQGERGLVQARETLLKFINKHKPFAIAIGNGTASRETDAFVRELLSENKLSSIIAVMVNEAGASVYSASDISREEFPDLDITIRGAISIARRLQDPLAELVKIEPKAIGVGQYQHDVYQPLLQEKLSEVVEACVNQVGVELNTASASLLSYVAGIGPSLAQKIVKHREELGAFKSRKDLLKVSGLGAKTFEQAAGFLRIRGGPVVLDASAVHPERYELVEMMSKDLGCSIQDLIADHARLDRIDKKRYYSASIGESTLADIITELKKPGRDPRASFEAPVYSSEVKALGDLKPGMKLKGIVTNVTAFGAFVDIGVHQDGLVHCSELTDRFIKDPLEVVRVGDKLQVEVLQVDPERKRISLTARQDRSQKRAKPEVKAAKTFAASPFSAL